MQHSNVGSSISRFSTPPEDSQQNTVTTVKLLVQLCHPAYECSSPLSSSGLKQKDAVMHRQLSSQPDNIANNVTLHSAELEDSVAEVGRALRTKANSTRYWPSKCKMRGKEGMDRNDGALDRGPGGYRESRSQ
jgi:hypothetical protein